MGGSGQPVEAGDDERVAWLKNAQHFFQLRSAAIKAGQFFLEYLVTPLGLEVLDLAFQILSCRGNTRIADQQVLSR